MNRTSVGSTLYCHSSFGMQTPTLHQMNSTPMNHLGHQVEDRNSLPWNQESNQMVPTNTMHKSYFTTSLTYTCGSEPHTSPMRGAALPLSTTAAVLSHCESWSSSTEMNPRGTLALPRQNPRIAVLVSAVIPGQLIIVALLLKSLRKVVKLLYSLPVVHVRLHKFMCCSIKYTI